MQESRLNSSKFVITFMLLCSSYSLIIGFSWTAFFVIYVILWVSWQKLYVLFDEIKYELNYFLIRNSLDWNSLCSNYSVCKRLDDFGGKLRGIYHRTILKSTECASLNDRFPNFLIRIFNYTRQRSLQYLEREFMNKSNVTAPIDRMPNTSYEYNRGFQSSPISPIFASPGSLTSRNISSLDSSYNEASANTPVMKRKPYANRVVPSNYTPGFSSKVFKTAVSNSYDNFYHCLSSPSSNFTQKRTLPTLKRDRSLMMTSGLPATVKIATNDDNYDSTYFGHVISKEASPKLQHTLENTQKLLEFLKEKSVKRALHTEDIEQEQNAKRRKKDISALSDRNHGEFNYSYSQKAVPVVISTANHTVGSGIKRGIEDDNVRWNSSKLPKLVKHNEIMSTYSSLKGWGLGSTSHTGIATPKPQDIKRVFAKQSNMSNSIECLSKKEDENNANRLNFSKVKKTREKGSMIMKRNPMDVFNKVGKSSGQSPLRLLPEVMPGLEDFDLEKEREKAKLQRMLKAFRTGSTDELRKVEDKPIAESTTSAPSVSPVISFTSDSVIKKSNETQSILGSEMGDTIDSSKSEPDINGKESLISPIIKSSVGFPASSSSGSNMSSTIPTLSVANNEQNQSDKTKPHVSFSFPAMSSNSIHVSSAPLTTSFGHSLSDSMPNSNLKNPSEICAVTSGNENQEKSESVSSLSVSSATFQSAVSESLPTSNVSTIPNNSVFSSNVKPLSTNDTKPNNPLSAEQMASENQNVIPNSPSVVATSISETPPIVSQKLPSLTATTSTTQAIFSTTQSSPFLSFTTSSNLQPEGQTGNLTSNNAIETSNSQTIQFPKSQNHSIKSNTTSMSTTFNFNASAAPHKGVFTFGTYKPEESKTKQFEVGSKEISSSISTSSGIGTEASSNSFSSQATTPAFGTSGSVNSFPATTSIITQPTFGNSIGIQPLNAFSSTDTEKKPFVFNSSSNNSTFTFGKSGVSAPFTFGANCQVNSEKPADNSVQKSQLPGIFHFESNQTVGKNFGSGSQTSATSFGTSNASTSGNFVAPTQLSGTTFGSTNSMVPSFGTSNPISGANFGSSNQPTGANFGSTNQSTGASFGSTTPSTGASFGASNQLAGVKFGSTAQSAIGGFGTAEPTSFGSANLPSSNNFALSNQPTGGFNFNPTPNNSFNFAGNISNSFSFGQQGSPMFGSTTPVGGSAFNIGSGSSKSRPMSKARRTKR